MGTTRIKVIDLSSDQKEIKTARKHAGKIALKPFADAQGKPKEEKAATAESAEKKAEITEKIAAAESTNLENTPGVNTGSNAGSHTGSESEAVSDKETKTARKPNQAKEKTSSRHLGTKYLKASSLVEKDKTYPADEAVDLLYKTSYTKFDPTVELHLTVVDKSVRGSITLPHAAGPKKEKRYLVFSDQKPESDKEVIWGSTETIGQIESGSLKPKRDFDAVIAAPKFMLLLAKVAKILGPAGLMPNPKNKTVTENIKEALTADNGDSHEFRTEINAPVIHTTLGKLSQKPQEITENAKALIAVIGSSKIKRATLSSTMGPAIKFDPASFQAK